MRNRRARRLAIRLAMCGVVGALATVGAAWALALAPTPPLKTLGMAVDSGVVWQVNYGEGFGARRAEWASIIQRPPAWDDAQWEHVQKKDFPLLNGPPPPPRISRDLPLDGNDRPRTRYEHARGWPFLAFWCEAVPASPTAWRGGFAVAKSVEPPPAAPLAALPYLILWPGFALDTAFYAAIAFTLWSAPGVARRRLRRARGHCPACGYNLQGAPTTTCPECGA